MEEAQLVENETQNTEIQTITTRLGDGEQLPQDMWYCQVDGSWKELDKFSGQGWFCKKNGGEEKLFGDRNIIPSVSPLHAEMETLIWAMKCMIEYQRIRIVFATDCHDVVKMVNSLEEWPTFVIHLEEYMYCKYLFEEIRIIFILRTINTMTDKLARGTRNHASVMEYISPALPTWIHKSR